MEAVERIVEYAVHLDEHMMEIMRAYGALTYALLFAVVFCETGLVVTPFLPGDSLLFVVGTLSVTGGLDLWLSAAVLMLAAFAGDNVNYRIGKAIGPRAFRKEKARFFSRKNLERTHAFFEKHGGKTIVVGRFIPVIRTFAPFVAGMGRMTYRKFAGCSALGSFLWVAAFVGAGRLFGNMRIVQENFIFGILLMFVVTSLPWAFAWVGDRIRKCLKKKTPPAPPALPEEE
jgi:membrane-associated protein